MEPTNFIKKAVVNITVVGVGGAGISVIKRLKAEQQQIGLITADTDERHLEVAKKASIETLQLGKEVTKGLSCGGKVEVGETVAKNDSKSIKNMLQGSDMLFITAGMGGGTGTGAAPVVAECAHEMGILTVGVVTIPFTFEGMRKKRTAFAGIEKMRRHLDALIIIHNDNLLKLGKDNKKLSLVTAFHLADNVLKQAISCVTELILEVGLINVDFADIRSIFRQNDNTEALLGIGEDTNALRSVQKAITSPLIERKIDGARGIILNINASADLTLSDINEAAKFINEVTDPDCNVILGTVIVEGLNCVRTTIIATDFVDDDKMQSAAKEEPSTAKEVPDAPKIELPSFMKKN